MARNLNSGISDKDIEATKLGYTPNARVFVQDVTEDGKLAPYVREIASWTNVTASLSVGGVGTATIQFANANDIFFVNGYPRTFNTGIADTNQRKDYLKSLALNQLTHVKQLDFAKRHDTLLSIHNEVGEGPAEANARFSGNFTNLTTDFGVNAASGPTVKRPGTVPQALMQRVFIDLLGRDGRVYAGFTGVLSQIVDVMTPEEMPSITWIVKDYWRLFSMTEFVVQQGVGFNQLEENLVLEAQAAKGNLNYYMSSPFDGMDGPAVIHILVDIMQGTFCQKVFAQQRADRRGTAFATEAANSPDLFFTREPYFQTVSGISQGKIIRGRPYAGATPLRRVKTITLDEDVVLAGSVLRKGRVIPGRDLGEGILDFDLVEQLTGEILIDRSIREGPQAIAYRATIQKVLQPFQAQRARGDAIMKKVAESTFFEIFFNGNGDLVYQIPRYNNFPGEYSPTATKKKVGSRFRGESEVESTVYEYDFNKAGELDFSPIEDGLPVKGHGFNYLISDLSLENWNLISTEENIVTNVRIPSGFNLVQHDGVIKEGFLTGITRVADVAQLQRRFGLRTTELQQVILPQFMTNQTSQGRRGFQDILALAALTQLNGNAYTGTVNLSFRPDLELGKNTLLLERGKLFYIVGTTHTVAFGKSGGTQLHLGFGHDLGERLPNPWVEARSLLLESPDTSEPLGIQIVNADLDNDPTAKRVELLAGTVPTQAEIQAFGTAPVSISDERYLVRPENFQELERTFGEIRGANNPSVAVKDYVDLDNPPGYVRLTNGFDSETNVPTIKYKLGDVTGACRVHHKLVTKFQALFNAINADIQFNPAWKDLRVFFLGTFVPRHMQRDVTRSLSLHSWGIAVDMIVASKGLAKPPGYIQGNTVPANQLLLPHFSKLGFVWGGLFSGTARDDIHWQYAGRKVYRRAPAGPNPQDND